MLSDVKIFDKFAELYDLFSGYCRALRSDYSTITETKRKSSNIGTTVTVGKFGRRMVI